MPIVQGELLYLVQLHHHLLLHHRNNPRKDLYVHRFICFFSRYMLQIPSEIFFCLVSVVYGFICSPMSNELRQFHLNDFAFSMLVFRSIYQQKNNTESLKHALNTLALEYRNKKIFFFENK
jgi:hypothetical protein